MTYSDFIQYFSTTRINRYSIAMGKSKRKAIKLYKANLEVSRAFYSLLGVVEVILRNRLNEELVKHFVDSNWIISQKQGFMSDPSLTFIHKKTGIRKTNDFLKREVIKVEERLRKAGVSITNNAIIPEQTFGFWTEFFELHHYKLLSGKPIKIFSNLPRGYG